MNKKPNLSDALGDAISKAEALSLIKSEPEAYERFQNFTPDERENILAFIRGQRGLKISYDPFFKKIFSPSVHPKRLESLLSELLQQKVHIIKVREKEGIRYCENAAYIVMDVLVELADGSCVNVEMQKRGLMFPGERSCCYAADFISREYAMVRAEKGKDFTYKDLPSYYQIVLMEESTGNFLQASPHYIHREQISYDSGAKVKALWHTIYVSLDTFHKVVQNIDNRLHAWLTFLSSDEPDDIMQLITLYPEFRELYHEIAEFRQNPKELIYMFSEALAIMDRNTIQLTLETELNEKKQLLAETIEQLSDKQQQLSDAEQQLSDKEQQLSAKEQQLAEQAAEIARLRAELSKREQNE